MKLTSVFFPWTSKVPVNLVFWKIFTGTFLGSRALFPESSRASGCVHGHFFGRFHGHFFEVHGQKKLNVHGHFLRFTGILWYSKFYVHGHFSMFTGTFARKNEISVDKRKIKVECLVKYFLIPSKEVQCLMFYFRIKILGISPRTMLGHSRETKADDQLG